VDVFNQAHAPKGLLTVVGGGHVSPVDPNGRAFGSVVQATTDFFDRYLKDDQGALERMQQATERGVTTLTFVAEPGRHVVLPVPKTTIGHLLATVTPTRGLSDGQAVTVAWEGYTPNVSINVVECSKSVPTQATDCDLHNAEILRPDPTGSGSLSFTVTTGTVGTGTCGATHPGCVIVVNQGASLVAAASVIVPISFGGVVQSASVASVVSAVPTSLHGIRHRRRGAGDEGRRGGSG
jgi:hypothetical protein